MEESAQVDKKNWGSPCEDCEGTGRNAVGGVCSNCRGLGQVSLFDSNLLPIGGRKVTRTLTETSEPVPPSKPVEEPAWKANQKFRAFARTERGYAIVSSCAEAAASDVRSNIEALRSGNLSVAGWKARQIWLKYWLLHRYPDLPEPLRHEAEDFRDLPYTPRRKRATK